MTLELKYPKSSYKEPEKINIIEMQKMKIKEERVAWITAYDLPFAYTAEKA